MKYNPQIHHRRSIRLKGYDYSQSGLYFITICCENRKCRFGKIENGEMILNEFGSVANEEWTKLPKRFPHLELEAFQIMPNHMHGIIVLNESVGAGFTSAPKQNVQPPAGFTSAPKQNVQPPGLTMQNTDDDNRARVNRAPAIGDIIGADNRARVNRAPTIGDIIGADNRARVNRAPTIGDIIGAYKSLVANACLDICKSKNELMGKLWQRNYYEHIIRNEQSFQTISEYIIKNPSKWNEDKFYEE